ncbi:MAG: hypothetical protein HXY20_03235 [Acidobacteria bacterium]|nr:hypothetical protein [Acidobacteriota bacterium]
MASSLYRLLGAQIGNGYQTAKPRRIFRDFVDATAIVTIGEHIKIEFQKRAHDPYLIAAWFDQIEVPIPWLDRKKLKLVFG